MDDHQIKMAFRVDRKERGIKITQFSHTEPYEIVIFVSLKKWLNTSNFIWLKLIKIFLVCTNYRLEKRVKQCLI